MDTLDKIYGKPIAGSAGAAAFVATDSTVTLAGGLYIFHATTACFIAFDTAATGASNRLYVPAGVNIPIQVGQTGSAPVLHVVRVTGDGTLYYTRMDRV